MQRAGGTRALPPVLVMAVALAAGSARAQEGALDSNDRVIAVTGVGRVFVAPDQAVVSLGATIQRDEAHEAQRELDAVMQKTLNAIRALGIAADNLQTAGLSLMPVYAETDLAAPAASADPA